jgi:phosphonate transport system permease protein
MDNAAVNKPSKWKWTIIALAVFAFYIWSSVGTGVSILELLIGIPQMLSLFAEFFPPDLSHIPTVLPALLDTVRMALLGTTFGAILAIPISLLAARNINHTSWLVLTARAVLNLIRTIPDLLFAALFVAVFGLGSFAGTLALTFFSFGIIAKLTSESLEAIDPGPLEAMTAVGSSKSVWIHYAVTPQILPQFTAYTLYVFEINIRVAAVLGLVGAGGIGLPLNTALNFFQYDKVSSIILVILILVIFIDYTSTKLRERLL